METPDPQLRTWTTRLPKETIEKLEKLAAYEGKPIQEVADAILNKFFDHLGPIPEKKSLLEGPWPGKQGKQSQ